VQIEKYLDILEEPTSTILIQTNPIFSMLEITYSKINISINYFVYYNKF